MRRFTPLALGWAIVLGGIGLVQLFTWASSAQRLVETAPAIPSDEGDICGADCFVLAGAEADDEGEPAQPAAARARLRRGRHRGQSRAAALMPVQDGRDIAAAGRFYDADRALSPALPPTGARGRRRRAPRAGRRRAPSRCPTPRATSTRNGARARGARFWVPMRPAPPRRAARVRRARAARLQKHRTPATLSDGAAARVPRQLAELEIRCRACRRSRPERRGLKRPFCPEIEIFPLRAPASRFTSHPSRARGRDLLFARIRRILRICSPDAALGAGFARPPPPLRAPRAASGRPTPHGRRPKKIGGVGARAPPRAE